MATYKIKKKTATNGTTEEILLPISSIDGLQTALDGKQASGSYATTTQVNAKYTKPSTGIPKSDLASDVRTSLGKADTAVQTETDPTVPTWAKASSKPTYTASEVGAVPTTRKVNGKALSADITLSASDVGALSTSGGNVSGHIYLTGAKEASSTGNTSQIIFGTSSNNHVAVSSNTNAIVINPTSSTTTKQIVLYLDKESVFPSGIRGYAKTSDIPTVNNGTLNITENGTSKGTFTANQSGNTTIAFTNATTQAAGLMSAADKKILSRFTYDESLPLLSIDGGASIISFEDDSIRIDAGGGLYCNGNEVATKYGTWTSGTSGTVKLPSAGTYQVRYSNAYTSVLWWNGASPGYSPLALINAIGTYYRFSVGATTGTLTLRTGDLSAGTETNSTGTIYYRRIGD